MGLEFCLKLLRLIYGPLAIGAYFFVVSVRNGFVRVFIAWQVQVLRVETIRVYARFAIPSCAHHFVGTLVELLVELGHESQSSPSADCHTSG